jgi:uncharacterized protein YndB with AHSA1/START domain
VPVPRSEVWRAFTEPESLVRWLAREASVAQDGLRLGWGDAMVACRVVQRTFESVLRFSWSDPSGALPETFVVLGLYAHGDHTVVELEHYGFGRGGDWDQMYVDIARAWSGYLKNLRSFLGGGPDLREDNE